MDGLCKQTRKGIRSAMRLSVDNIKNKLTLQTEEVCFDNYIVYTGMILRNDHPEFEELLELYKAFVKRASSLYQVQPK